jgi:hypothetical protein
MSSDTRVAIESEFAPAGDLAAQLQNAVPPDVASFQVEDRDATFRLEPTIVVAIVTAGGTALSALIAGLLTTARNGKSATVVIERADGTRVELPGTWTADQIRQAVETLSAPSVRRIKLLEP